MVYRQTGGRLAGWTWVVKGKVWNDPAVPFSFIHCRASMIYTGLSERAGKHPSSLSHLGTKKGKRRTEVDMRSFLGNCANVLTLVIITPSSWLLSRQARGCL